MAAINKDTWDGFFYLVQNLAYQVSEEYFDRPNELIGEIFADEVTTIFSYYDEFIAPHVPNQAQRKSQKALDSLMKLSAKVLKAKNSSADEVSLVTSVALLEDLAEAHPELSGRWENWNDRFMRRRNMVNKRHFGDQRLNQLFDLHASGKAAFFLDLDGSLVEAEPGRHTGYDTDVRLQYILNVLNKQSGSALALVTGRPDLYVEEVFPQGRFFTATEHGAIVREAVAGEILRSFEGAFDMSKVTHDIRMAMIKAGLPEEESYVEGHKTASLTAQFTLSSDPERAAQIIGDLLREVEASPENRAAKTKLLFVDGNVPGNRAMDLVPETADKGKTLQWFYDNHPRIFKGKTPVMIGDSGGDRTAMQWALDQGGFAIGVGNNAPDIANISLRDVKEGRDLLVSLGEEHLQANLNNTARSEAQKKYLRSRPSIL